MEIPDSSSSLRCHKCRHILLAALNRAYIDSPCNLSICSSYNIKNLIFIQEDKLPSWIKLRLEIEQWTKGKLLCENCGYKVGSFDFISGRKCECGSSVLPAVHFVSSQVDRPMPVNDLCNK